MITNDVVVTAAIFGTPNLDDAIQAVNANQYALGKNLAQYYGEKAGKKFTSLLLEHEELAVKLVNAMIAGEPTEQLNQQWHANGQDVAKFLCSINPCIKYQTMKNYFFDHLQCITDRATSLLNQDYAKAQEASNKSLKHIAKMAEYISCATVELISR